VKIKTKPTTSLAIGRAVHEGVAAGLRAKLDAGGVDPAQDLMVQQTSDTFDAHAPYVLLDPDEQLGPTKDKAVALTKLHHKVVMPQIQPALVEEDLKFEIGGVAMYGIVDCVTTEGMVRDTKTSAKRPSADNGLAVDFQTAVYVAGVEAQGLPVSGVSLDYLVSTKAPAVEVVQVPRADVDVERAKQVARSVAHQMSTLAVVAQDNMQVCSWCPYRRMCHGQKWWTYVQDPSLAVDAAARLIPDQLLPPGAPR
jgi:CRISPR/Cas system-associated exonuclease Cas4 (RecB family)